MAALATVQDYVTAARFLLQDETVTYRYSDATLVAALGYAVLEARRIRPDLFIGRFDAIPSYTTTTMNTQAVAIDEQYRLPFVHFIVGHVQFSDDEPTQDSRAAGFMQMFTSTLKAG